MINLNKAKKTYPLLTMRLGLISFLTAGIVISLVFTVIYSLLSGVPNSIFGMPFIGAGGGLLLGLLLGMKGKLGKITLLSAAGAVLGIISGFIFGEGFASLAPSLAETEIPNIVLFFFVNGVYCAVMATVYHGAKSIWFFALTGALCSMPAALLMYVTNGIVRYGFDLNFLLIVTTMGLTSGICIGLFELFKPKRKEKV